MRTTESVSALFLLGLVTFFAGCGTSEDGTDATSPPDTTAADLSQSDAGCTPQCSGKQCGDDGCGGTCGTCTNPCTNKLDESVCVDGQCASPCCPDCTDKDCGGDGCGNTCGTCTCGYECSGQSECIYIACDGRECGPDGCGGTCGSCVFGTCEKSTGKCECVPNCADNECGPDGCGGECGQCSSGEICVEGNCLQKCGTNCPVQSTCISGACIPWCVEPDECFFPETEFPYEVEWNTEGYCNGDVVLSAAAKANTGEQAEDIVGVLIENSNPPSYCDCQPSCTGKECGDGGCPDQPNACGTCGPGKTCVDGQCKTSGCQPNCGVMVTVPSGPFMQGCNESLDDACDSDEYPYHEVNVPAFEIDKYEVTSSRYGECVDAGGCTEPSTGSSSCNWGESGKDDHPVNCIDWYQAGEYCEWAGKRLCSESEWEKASRGTDGRIYPWGNEEPTCEYCVMDDGDDGCGTDSTWPVGSKPAGASPYGAHDMSGNVWEWVQDRYHDDYDGAPTDGSAWESPSASYRVVRGGGFVSYGAGILRSSLRYYDYPDAGYGVYLGVRCCRSK